MSSGGGGGYGSPLDRPVVDVQNDVRQGYVSVKSAAELYGVVLDANTFIVDEAATARLRKSLKSHETSGYKPDATLHAR